MTINLMTSKNTKCRDKPMAVVNEKLTTVFRFAMLPMKYNIKLRCVCVGFR